MMMKIDDYLSQIPYSNNIKVLNVCDMGQLRTWLDIVNTALFGCELVTVEHFNDILNLDNTYFYLGILDGKAVTACMTITNGDTSVLEMVATLEEYRHKGVATITIDKALIDLRRKGVKTISLRAEVDGINLYRRLGFKECFVRTVATCDLDKIYKEACPCHVKDDIIEKARMIFSQSSNIQSFINEMNNQKIIGKHIWYEPKENVIYIKKMYACDCGGGCSSNNTIIGQRCHCEYVNHLNESIPLSYCKCAAAFFEPVFAPLFGENITIEPVKTVLSGADECIIKITLDV
jgi:GNAT superfamily N-acetyltransferase